MARLNWNGNKQAQREADAAYHQLTPKRKPKQRGKRRNQVRDMIGVNNCGGKMIAANGCVEMYADGGVIGPNPSVDGGTWAWCQVDGAGKRVASRSGIVTPDDVQLPTVTNNVTELIAIIFGLEALPEFWAGTVYTDSLVTFYRVSKKDPKFNGVPEWLRERTWKARQRLGRYTVKLLGGHPTREELAAGRRRDGVPCSPHNVFCDDLCQSESKRFRCKESSRDGVYVGCNEIVPAVGNISE